MANAAGRPCKRNGRTDRRIVEALTAGNTRRVAALCAGISAQTFYTWLEQFPDFLDIVEKAEAEAEEARVAQIVRAADDGTWQAAAWWLERRRNAEWGRKEKLVHTGDSEEPVKVFVSVDTERV